ncbi:hypothetical protein HDU76_010040, partial [Blyttiomyces sp. JEL0837]
NNNWETSSWVVDSVTETSSLLGDGMDQTNDQCNEGAEDEEVPDWEGNEDEDEEAADQQNQEENVKPEEAAHRLEMILRLINTIFDIVANTLTDVLPFGVCTFGGIPVALVQGCQLDLDKFCNRVLAYDDTLISSLQGLLVHLKTGEAVRYEVHCTPTFDSEAGEQSSISEAPKRVISSSADLPPPKWVKSTTSVKGKGSVIDLTRDHLQENTIMTNLSFLVNRFNSLGTNPYQLAHEYTKQFPSNMAEVLYQKKLPNVNFEFGRPNEAALIALSLLIERYSAVGLQNLISNEICSDLEDFVNAVHANQVGVAESESEVTAWDHFGSVISGQFAQYDLGPNFDRLDSMIESVEDLMTDYVLNATTEEPMLVELHSLQPTY